MTLRGPREEAVPVTIAQLADLTGVSNHTLRYYERMGLVPLVGRDRSSGHRRYTVDHARWIRFHRNLREAGMSIRDLRTYARLVAKGAGSWPQRKLLLATHRARVDAASRSCASIAASSTRSSPPAAPR